MRMCKHAEKRNCLRHRDGNGNTPILRAAAKLASPRELLEFLPISGACTTYRLNCEEEESVFTLAGNYSSVLDCANADGRTVMYYLLKQVRDSKSREVLAVSMISRGLTIEGD